jgi:hypothetical protein
MPKRLKLANGNPFLEHFSPPVATAQAFSSATWQFQVGGVWSSADLAPVIETSETAEVLLAALDTLEQFMNVDLDDRIADGHPWENDWRDQLPLNLGSRYVERVEWVESEDGAPPMTSIGHGRWLSSRHHLAAMAILQIDRATSAFAVGDFEAFALMMWDTHELFGQMAAVDEEQIRNDLQEAPIEASRTNGRRGAAVRHQGTSDLKAWALKQAGGLVAADIDIARALADRLPAHFQKVSKDPERLIYDALRARRRHTNRG